MRALFHTWGLPEPVPALWRSTVVFCVLDVFFTGLVGAYAFTVGGVAAVLAFIIAQQSLSILGHWCGNLFLQSPWWSPLHLQRLGLLGLACVLFLAGAAPLNSEWSLVLLALGGGLTRGLTYCARQWMELQVKDAGVRQRYLSAVEAVNTLVKVAGPALAALLLWWQPGQVRIVLASVGLVFLLALSREVKDRFDAPLAQPIRVIEQWRTKAFWRPAPYFVSEGAAHAMRLALFISGAMTVVGSIKAFSILEAASSLLAAVFLVQLSRRQLSGASYRLLAGSLCVMALAWLSLLGALHWAWLLPVFVVLHSMATPLANAQKAGLTMAGIAQAPGRIETNLFARSLLLVVSRVGVLLAFYLLAQLGLPSELLLHLMTAGVVLLLPLEYWTAKLCLQPKACAPVLPAQLAPSVR